MPGVPDRENHSGNYFVVSDGSRLEAFFAYTGPLSNLRKAWDSIGMEYPGRCVMLAFGYLEEVRQNLFHVDGICSAEPEKMVDGKIPAATRAHA